MTRRTGSGSAEDTRFERIWQVLDTQAAGRVPGYVAAVRIGGQAGRGRPRTSTRRAAPSPSC
jgi:hypothetical protein